MLWQQAIAGRTPRKRDLHGQNRTHDRRQPLAALAAAALIAAGLAGGAAVLNPAPVLAEDSKAGASKKASEKKVSEKKTEKKTEKKKAAKKDPKPVSEHVLTREDAALFAKAFALRNRGQATEALALAKTGKNPLMKKTFYWFWLLSGTPAVTYQDIEEFISKNPGWPLERILRRHAESRLPATWDDAKVLRYFGANPPDGVWGVSRLAKVLTKLGRKDEGDKLIRDKWVTERFRGRKGRAYQTLFLGMNKSRLRDEDHFARAEHLLWKKRRRELKSMLSLLDKDDRKVVDAFRTIVRKRGRPGKARLAKILAGIPKKHKDHELLKFAQAYWHLRNKSNDTAIAFMKEAPGSEEAAEAWWDERGIMMRRLIRQQDYDTAYAIVKPHGLKSAKLFAEAEFFAGWLALRFQKKPEVALKHFRKLYTHVKYPISVARATYWTGRALEDMKKPEAKSWFRHAANHSGTYYGQLAAIRLGGKYTAPEAAAITPADHEAFEKKELVRVTRLMKVAGATDRQLRIFLLQIYRNGLTATERSLASQFALELGDRKIAIAIGKLSIRKGDPFVPSAYPMLSFKPDHKGTLEPEPPLLLGLIRQESMFDPKAKSWVGARGLMQLMPFTALRVSRQLDVKYDKGRLTADPEYNIMLGRKYISDRLVEFSGNYAMAAAGYNAGEHRVIKWIGHFGDPRAPQTDIIDWVEYIPFRETRNYVQRVIENMNVYRWRLGLGPLIPESIEHMYGPHDGKKSKFYLASKENGVPVIDGRPKPKAKPEPKESVASLPGGKEKEGKEKETAKKKDGKEKDDTRKKEGEKKTPEVKEAKKTSGEEKDGKASGKPVNLSDDGKGRKAMTLTPEEKKGAEKKPEKPEARKEDVKKKPEAKKSGSPCGRSFGARSQDTVC